jgi:hypothetical protein
VINKIFKISRNQHKVKSCGGTSWNSTSDEKLSVSDYQNGILNFEQEIIHPESFETSNSNWKESIESSQYDKYIEEYRYKSTETKRKRVLYTCKYEECSKQYHKRWNLIDHIKTHLGVTPYKCDIWDTTFVQKGNLKKHMRQHAFPDLKKRKAFECEHCNKSYTERYNLTHHMKKHAKTALSTTSE